MSLLGIDVGTSGCKSAVFSEEGDLLGFAYEEYDYLGPRPGWAELDSRLVWNAIKRTIGKAVTDASSNPVKALCISSLGEAVVPVTMDRQILGPAILNFDVRGEEYLEELSGRISNDRIYATTGNTLGNQYTLTKLKWLEAHRPELYRRTDRFLLWSGFVAFMLGAEPTADFSLANRTLLFDLESADWSDEMLRLAGLHREKLPPTVPSGTVIGTVRDALAADLGLPKAVPIISGAHDQCCNGIGAGVLAPGQAMYGMGSYLCLMPVFDRRPPTQPMIERGLNTEHHAAPDRFVSFLYNQGGLLVKWFRSTFAASELERDRSGGDELYRVLLAEMPENPSRVVALPHFTATGPPRFLSSSSGVLTGLKLDTSRGEILKGLLESMTFYIRESFETLPDVDIDVLGLRAVGGGSKSDAWVQITADILGRPVLRPGIAEAGALGAAILAGTGSGIFRSLDEGVESMVRPGRSFEPDPARQSVYDERFRRYRRLHPLLEDYLRGLDA